MTQNDGIPLRLPSLPALREKLLAIDKVPGDPLYVYDEAEALEQIRRFRTAFADAGLPVRICFAIKSNSFAGLLKTVTGQGEFLDASSRRELALALAAGAKHIIYTGPAKTALDFAAILEHPEEITVNLESERELLLLSQMASRRDTVVRCGLRIQTGSQKGWTKFGLPLNHLRSFWERARKLPGIDFCGMHFHISMNKTPKKYVATIGELGAYLKRNFSQEERGTLQYLDIGGGFYPQPFEGIHAWNPKQTMSYFAGEDHLEAILADKYHPRYLPILADPIETFAQEIAAAFRRDLSPIAPNLALHAEPGRYLCHSCMHMLLTLVDLKDGKRGIVDGGNNMVGWEKHQFFNYTPLFNVTHFSGEREIPFITYGSLCTPDDIWGYYLYCSDISEGDTLCMPYQGAYTFTLAQNFIRNIPEVIPLQSLRELSAA